MTAAPNTQVLARFDAGTPALVERKVGSGRVMLWASTLDLSWSDLPLKPVFLPFLHRSMVHLANYTEPTPWLTIGQVFDPDASSAKAQATGRLALTPSGKRMPLEDEGSSAQVLELQEQGFYEIRGQKANSDVTVVASNVDPAEDEHAWAELQPYVPAPHAAMAAAIRQIEATLARIYGSGEK